MLRKRNCWLRQVIAVHMKARIYGPKLGRFLSADRIIQDPYSTQSLNRYSYVFNNPLNATDPTGEEAVTAGIIIVAIAASLFAVSEYLNEPIFAQIGGIVGAVGCGYFAAPLGIACAGFVSFGSAHAQGATYEQSLKAGAISAASAAAFYGLGEAFSGTGGGFFQAGGVGHTLAHGVVSGIFAELQGGSFAHSFISAIITKGISHHVTGRIGANADQPNSFKFRLARTSIAILAGGTTSELTGGKFVNGALTAAIAHSFNCELHLDKCLQEVEGGIPQDAFREQTICKARCHGYDVSQHRPMTPQQAKLLNSLALLVVTAPLSGGLSVLITTGKVIQLSIQGQLVVRATVVSGQAERFRRPELRSC